MLDPSDGWNIAHPRSAKKIRPCGRQDVWLSILSQLFLVALVEGNLRNINVCGDLLTVFDNGRVEDLPYPIGQE